MIVTSISVFIAICIIILIIVTTYNRFQSYIIRINEAEANIDSILRKRFDLLNKSIDIIKAHINTEDDVLGVIVKLRSKKISNFELDRQLYEAIKEFSKYKETYPELKKSEVFTHTDISLNESEAEIVAFRKYYNDIITDYNKMVRAFPTNFIAKICGYKIRTYYDGKNTEDEITNDFKL